MNELEQRDYSHQRIFNYELQPDGRQVIPMPKHADILGLIEKSGFPYLLAAVDPMADHEDRVFRIVTTGEIFNREILDYIGTLRIGGESANGAWYTMHVFEVQTELVASNPDPIDPRYAPDLKVLKVELLAPADAGMRAKYEREIEVTSR